MVSCNDAMMQIAAKTGATLFSKYQRLFGFGSKTGIDLPGEADAKNLMFDADNMKSADLATNSFGQNFNCTMVQMAAAYCSVINGGSYYEPHVVKQILNEQGAVVKKYSPTLVRETVSESTSNLIKTALFRTVEEGTGKAAQVEGYEIAGKTGTAEKIPRALKNYLVSFCGFAPAMDPEVLVYVTIDTPHVEDQPHSTFASKVFSQIMGDILPYLNVFPAAEYEELPEGDVQASETEAADGTEKGDGSSGASEIEIETKVYETDEYIPDDEGTEHSGAASEQGYPVSDILNQKPEITITSDNEVIMRETDSENETEAVP